ncbi:MAG: hypothetical protein WCB51_00005, partial [Candidatus Dormiibacterota bacterium]
TEGSHQVRAVAIAPNASVINATAISTLQVVHTASVVTGVTASISGSAILVSWNGSAGVTYNVYRATASGGFAAAATGISGGSFADSSLPGAQSTGYVVTETDAYGNESAFSQARWVTTPVAWNTSLPEINILTTNATERPDQAIVDLAAQVSAAGGLSSVGFYYAPIGGAWTSIPDVLPINPGAPTAPGGPSLGSASGLGWATTLNTTAVAAGKYVFRVVATDAFGRTAQQLDSFVVGAAGARGPPTVGFNLNVTPTSTGIHLTWTGLTGDSFQVRRSVGASTGFSTLTTTTAASFVDSAVVPGNTYRYQVVRLSPSIAYTSIQSATAISSFDASGKATSADGSVAVSLAPASSDQLAIDVVPNSAPPALPSGVNATGSAFDVNATSIASGSAVHQLDQPATLTFAVPSGLTETQAQGLAVFHYEQASGTWVREPTTLDWAHKQLIATVTHFSLFVVGLDPCVVGGGTPAPADLCWDGGTAPATVTDTVPLDTLTITPDAISGWDFTSSVLKALSFGFLNVTAPI